MTNPKSVRELQEIEWIRLLGAKGFAQLQPYRRSMGVLVMATIGCLALLVPALLYEMQAWLVALFFMILLPVGALSLVQLIRVCDAVAEWYGIDRRVPRRYLDVRGLSRCERSIQKIRDRSSR